METSPVTVPRVACASPPQADADLVAPPTFTFFTETGYLGTPAWVTQLSDQPCKVHGWVAGVGGRQLRGVNAPRAKRRYLCADGDVPIAQPELPKTYHEVVQLYYAADIFMRPRLLVRGFVSRCWAFVTRAFRPDEVQAGGLLEQSTAGVLYGIHVHNPEQVAAFILLYPWLAPMIQEARIQILSVFGAASRIVLDVFHEPETGSAECLSLLISTALKADCAQELLDKLDEKWWVDAVARSRNKLSISLELRDV
jgi:hypothetical protein